MSFGLHQLLFPLHATSILAFFLAAAGWASPSARPGFPVLRAFTTCKIGAGVFARAATQNMAGPAFLESQPPLTFGGESRQRRPADACAWCNPGLESAGTPGAASAGEIGWLEQTGIRFPIATLSWRTNLAYAGCLLSGLLLAFGVCRLRTLRAHARRLESLVRERTMQLEQADATRTTFLAHLSHEIRNPINGILGASLALELSGLSPDQGKEVKTLRHCSLFLSSLVEDMLDIIKLESRTMEHRPAVYDLRAVIGVIESMLAGQAENAGVRFSATVGEKVPALVMGDAGRVQQILVNFVLNAFKFAASRPVELIVKAEDGWLLFEVADRGPGIPEAEKAKLFTSFSRLTAAKKSGIAGSGLGLAVSRALAHHMGGQVGFHAREGGGSVFWLRLALAPAAPVPEFAGTAEFMGAHALIVEDAAYNATTLSFMLSQLGFRCDRACDADQALRLIREQSYDSVFVDYDLPGMSGAELVRLAKTAPPPGKTPLFIATTAYATPAIRRTCRQAGMDAFVSKPITPEQLRNALLAFAAPLRACASVQLPGPGGLQFGILDYLGGSSAEGRQASRLEFEKVVHTTLQRLTNSLSLGHRESIARASHQLVGHARMVGAENLARLAEQLEGKAPNSPLAELTALADKIDFLAREITLTLVSPTRAA